MSDKPSLAPCNCHCHMRYYTSEIFRQHGEAARNTRAPSVQGDVVERIADRLAVELVGLRYFEMTDSSRARIGKEAILSAAKTLAELQQPPSKLGETNQIPCGITTGNGMWELSEEEAVRVMAEAAAAYLGDVGNGCWITSAKPHDMAHHLYRALMNSKTGV